MNPSVIHNSYIAIRMIISYGKVPKKINLKEERFILAHSFRGFNPWSLG
jgi:hypothetical protein